MVDNRSKNAMWRVFDDDGGMFDKYEHAQLAVLMDIRDELQELNYTLGCQNCLDIPNILRRIQRNTAKPKAKAKRKAKR